MTSLPKFRSSRVPKLPPFPDLLVSLRQFQVVLRWFAGACVLLALSCVALFVLVLAARISWRLANWVIDYV